MLNRRRLESALRRQDSELARLEHEKEQALQRVAALEGCDKLYKETKRKLQLERAAHEETEKRYTEENRQLKRKVERRGDKLKHSEVVIATLRGQIGNAAAEFRSKFPGRQITWDRRRAATSSSCEALVGSDLSASISDKYRSTSSSSSAAPSSDEASVTANAGSQESKEDIEPEKPSQESVSD